MFACLTAVMGVYDCLILSSLEADRLSTSNMKDVHKSATSDPINTLQTFLGLFWGYRSCSSSHQPLCGEQQPTLQVVTSLLTRTHLRITDTRGRPPCGLETAEEPNQVIQNFVFHVFF